MNSVSQAPGPQKPSLFLILTFFTGIPLAFWSCKCLIMLVFQRKFIYLPYIPFGARKDKLEDVPLFYLDGIECEQVSIPSEKGVTLHGILATTAGGSHVPNPEMVIVYIQGNAGGPLNMIPAFQSLLTALRPTVPVYGPQPAPGDPPPLPHYAILSIAPRSYWKSTRKSPSERAITTDYLHILHHALDHFPNSRIVVYGHSLGAAVAICLLSQLYPSPPIEPTSRWKAWYSRLPPSLTHDPKFNRVHGLVVENPFTSIPDMVHAFYPEKWLPHHYIAPLAVDKWDSADALRNCASHPTKRTSVLARVAPDALILQSKHDEIIPGHMGETIYELAQAVSQSDPSGRRVVIDASHNTGWMNRTWADEIKRHLELLSSMQS